MHIMYIYVCMYVYRYDITYYVYVHVHVHVCVYVDVDVDVDVYVLYMYICICICIYICTWWVQLMIQYKMIRDSTHRTFTVSAMRRVWHPARPPLLLHWRIWAELFGRNGAIAKTHVDLLL